MTFRHPRWSALGCVVALFTVSACLPGVAGSPEQAATDASPSLKRFYQQKISWEPCGNGFQCGKVAVPVDYDRPGWRQIELAVTRLPANDRGERVGSLVVNPGGPGASGVRYAQAAQRLFPDEVRARFDVVGFDPRGVGRSAPIHCVPDRKLARYLALDTTPDSSDERQQLVRAGKDFARGCARHSGRLLPHVGTVNAARDMDVLRAALREDRLTYYGASYGTKLGATYAELFPDNVRALVLDGAVDPTLGPMEAGLSQARGFETALRAFAADCVDRQACPLGSGSVESAIERLEAFFGRTDGKPIPTSNISGGADRRLTQGLAKFGLASALYNKTYWQFLRDALRMAFSGDGTQLLRLADALAGRKPDGSYSNLMEANMAISCVDERMPEKVPAYAQAAKRGGRVAPHFGEFVAWGVVPCAFWPASPGENIEIDAAGAAPILVIGTTRDPATPYEWARALARQLEPGVLLTRKGDGHTAYGQGSSCIDEAVNRYLIEGEPPETGTVCG